MRMLVLGGGLQGSACAFDLLTNTEAEVTLADSHPDRVRPFLKEFKGKRLSTVRLDARDAAGVTALMEGHDAAMSALPYYLNGDIARQAVAAGIHFADLGGNTEIVQGQQELDEPARERKISIMPDCGLAPGLVNILAAEGIRRLDAVDSVKMFVGGLPSHPEPPLNYHIVYSLEGVLDYYTTPSWIVRNGAVESIDALSEIEPIEFPEPVGCLEAFHTAGGISTMPWVFEGKVPAMEYKTLRYPGHAEAMRVIRELGLLDLEPVAVDGSEVRPRDVFVTIVDPKLRKTDARDLVALKVIVSGTRGDQPVSVGFELLDYYDEEREMSAMMRTTGFSLSITGQMQVGGRVERFGVTPAYEGMPFAPYVAALAKRGIVVRELE